MRLCIIHVQGRCSDHGAHVGIKASLHEISISKIRSLQKQFILWALNDSLRPQASAADRGDVVAEAILLVGFGEVTAPTKSAWSEDKVVQALAIGKVFGIEPDLFE
jgi:hypothetical protein